MGEYSGGKIFRESKARRISSSTLSCHWCTIETAIVGTAKISAKNRARPDFRLCSAGFAPSSIKVAEYPAPLIVLMISLLFISAGAKICTVSVAKLTLALTPSISFRDFSIEFTHDEQVIPETEKVRGSTAI